MDFEIAPEQQDLVESGKAVGLVADQIGQVGSSDGPSYQQLIELQRQLELERLSPQNTGVTVVEWPERLGPALPAARLDVRIDGSGDEAREITLIAGTADYDRYLDAVP